MISESDTAPSPPAFRESRAALANAIESVLWRHVIDPWFPRCIDHVRGGYDCDFDRRWRPNGPQNRMLEFQARQMRSAARLALACPEDGRFAEYAQHGFRYLRDVMWDRQHGGWYILVGRDGTPLLGGTKHTHGSSYAVQGCMLVYLATGDPDARALAEEAFEWLDSRAHDDVYGGYHNWLTRDGRLIRSRSDIPASVNALDHVTNSVGIKDVNDHGDWLETLVEIPPSLSTPRMRERLAELATLFLEHITTPDGDVHYAFREDWRPIPQPERFGYTFESVPRLLAAAERAGPADQLRERAFALGRHAFQFASRGKGRGYIAFRAIEAPARLDGVPTVNRRRPWWVQVAALYTLAIFASSRRDDAGEYEVPLHEHWRFLERAGVDPVFNGFYPVIPQDLPRRLRPYGRFGNPPDLFKGDVWKDASHEVDCLLWTMRLLRGSLRARDAANPLLTEMPAPAPPPA